jgi:hypothetical protein
MFNTESPPLRANHKAILKQNKTKAETSLHFTYKNHCHIITEKWSKVERNLNFCPKSKYYIYSM